VLRPTPEKTKRHVGDTAVSWILHDMEAMTKGKSLNERQSKYQNIFKGLMTPPGPALDHPAAPLLLEMATLGCMADVGKGWTMEMLEAAIEKGLHPSAMEPDAAGQLREETLEKVAQGKATPGW
jgi:hypothetical protein